MKKFLIVLLFFGFSFGQSSFDNMTFIDSKGVTYDLIGTWKHIEIEQSYIFLKNGTGYYLFENDNKTETLKMKWTVVNGGRFKGTLILDFGLENYQSIRDFKIYPKEGIDNEFLSYWFGKSKWNGGSVITLWDTNQKTPDGLYSIFEKY
tara:strand:+ start:143 stop:589 length:447 start_codon:yes stop_codon:yes gene_type:complete